MKKIILFFLVFLFNFSIVYADNSVNSIDMDIYIDKNGNANITEVWDAYLDNGTEGYKGYYNLGNSEITNFSVSMNDTTFENKDSWDVSDSFSDKQYKSGINEVSNGVELCFGITKIGHNTYTLKYTITNFVVSLKDSQMVYWTLLDKDFNPKPDNVYIKIYSDFRYADNYGVWGFGNYGGTAYVYDGYIEMSSDGTLNLDEYMTILIQFPSNTFNASTSIDNNFEYYLDMAKEGSTAYKENKSSNVLSIIMGILSKIVTYGTIVFIIIMIAKRPGKGKIYNGKTYNKLSKDIPIFRDIPCNKDIFYANSLANTYRLNNKKTDFLGAVLLKWLKEDRIKFEKKEGGIFNKISTSIVFLDRPNENSNNNEKEIYGMMVAASIDGTLEENEFKKWCNKNYKQILSWFDEVLDSERYILVEQGKITEEKVGKIFKTTKYNATSTLIQDAEQLAGLKKFLIEFSNMNDKEAIEVKLWQEYLMFAQIFGIADKVAKQFKKLYPDVITDLDYDNVIIINNFNSIGVSSANTARSRAESYSSGGGGFSSGGGGGGSFGGGGGGGFR